MPGSLLNRLFGTKSTIDFSVLGADMHSHLIPSIDDGSTSLADTITMIAGMQSMGYSRIITTPHIQPELFENSESTVRSKFNELCEELQKQNIDVDLRVAAEYYIDENFLDRIMKGDPFLIFGDNYILVEVSMSAESKEIDKAIFELLLRGYKVILAHAERYPYMYIRSGLDIYKALRDKEVLLQVNLRSFTGGYGDIQRRIARELAEAGLISFLGTDLHRPLQISLIEEAMHDDYVQQLLQQNTLLNSTL